MVQIAIGRDKDGSPLAVPAIRFSGTKHSIEATSGGSIATSSAITDDVDVVYFVTDNDVYVDIGPDASASTSHPFVPKDTPMLFLVHGGADKFACLAKSATAAVRIAEVI